MANTTATTTPAQGRSTRPAAPPAAAARYRRLPSGVAELLAIGLVGLAGLAAFAAERLAAPSNLALVFVLPVVIAATAFGLRAALAAVVASVLVFDLFFIEPRYTLRVGEASDLWALGLLLATALIVSGLAARARGRAAEADAAATEADALQQMAHAILHGASDAEAAKLAAEGLSRVFRAPAAVVEAAGDRCRPAAGGLAWSDADEDAALWVIEQGLPLRAGSYPHDAARYDLWPAPAGARRQALAVDFSGVAGGRPEAPERFVEAVAAYLALAGSRR